MAHPNHPRMEHLSLNQRSTPPPGFQAQVGAFDGQDRMTGAPAQRHATPPNVAPPPGFRQQGAYSGPMGYDKTTGAPYGSPAPLPQVRDMVPITQGLEQQPIPGAPQPQAPQQAEGEGQAQPGNGPGQNTLGGPGARTLGMPPPQPQQLPPQMFTTAAQLLDLTDKKLMVALRDGRKLIGVLRSWDQFANLVLQSTSERLFTTSPPYQYTDIPRGTFLVRGENVLLLGEIDLDKDDESPRGFELGQREEVHKRWIEEGREEKKKEGRKGKVLRGWGFGGEVDEGIL